MKRLCYFTSNYKLCFFKFLSIAGAVMRVVQKTTLVQQLHSFLHFQLFFFISSTNPCFLYFITSFFHFSPCFGLLRKPTSKNTWIFVI